LDARLLRLPPVGPVSLPLGAGAPNSRAGLNVLLVQVETDGVATGLGFACVADGGRSLLAAIEDDLGPLLIGEDPLNHGRHWVRAQALENPAAHWAYAVIDVALWDLKGKIANLPLWRLLGGVRQSAKTFTAETSSGHLSADDVIAIA